MNHLRPTLLLVLWLCMISVPPCPCSAASGEPGALWRITGFTLSPQAGMDKDEAKTWVGKTIRISQTSLDFEGKSCRITPEIKQIETGVFLAGMDTTPNEMGITAEHLDLVKTGCDIPELETLLALPNGRFVLLNDGVFFFMEKADTLRQAQRTVDIKEAGVSLGLPKSVRLVPPNEEKGAGLRFWYRAAPLSELDSTGEYPFNRVAALRDRAALVASDFGITPANSLAVSEMLEKLPDDTPVKIYSQTRTKSDCGVRFRNMAVFFHQGWVVQLALSAASETIVKDNPGYFESCDTPQGPAWTWRQGMDAAFHQALANGSVSGLAAQWQETFDNMLAGIELHTPQSTRVFLLQDHSPCRTMLTDSLQERFPDHYIVPEQSFALQMPLKSLGARTHLIPACLTTLSDGLSNRLVITVQGGVLNIPTPQPPTGDIVRAIAIQDINEDSLPDLIMMMEAPHAQMKARYPNMVYCSRIFNTGPEWLSVPDYGRMILGLETAIQARKVLSDVRSELKTPDWAGDRDRGCPVPGRPARRRIPAVVARGVGHPGPLCPAAILRHFWGGQGLPEQTDLGKSQGSRGGGTPRPPSHIFWTFSN